MSFLKIERIKSVLHISLCRPEAHNALNPEIIDGLTKTFRALKKDLEVSVVILKGEGPSFCAGGDLNWMRKSLKFSLAQNLKDTQKLSDMYETIFQCPVPVLAHAHGSVMGGGIGVTAVCDLVASDVDSKFCLSEVKLGLVPSIISPYVLKKVAESEAIPLMLTAEVFRAHHAEKISLVHFVGNREECQSYLEGKAKMICQNGPEAVRITKELMRKIKVSTWEQARKLTVKTIAQRRISREGQEGMNAFFDKRAPTWRKFEE